jgi:hypothetical protein
MFFGKRDCCPMAYLLSPSTFAITPTPGCSLSLSLSLTHTHTHTHTRTRAHTHARMHARTHAVDQLYSSFEAVHSEIVLWYNEILLKFMEIKMNIIFACLKNIASIILATIVLACRIVPIFRNAPDCIPVFAHCTSRHLQNFVYVLGSYKFCLNS